MKSVGKFLVGGIIGGVVGFLLAPKRGRMVGGALPRRTRATESILGRDAGLGRFSALTSQQPAPAVATSTEAPAPSAETAKTAVVLPQGSLETAPQAIEIEVVDLAPEMTSDFAGSTESVPLKQPKSALAPVSEVLPESTAELWSEPAPAASPVDTETDASPLVVEEVSAEAATEPIGEAVEVQPRIEAEETEGISTVETDLRARIEETRRRIQAELERPFQLDATPSAVEEAQSPIDTRAIADVSMTESSQQTEGAAAVAPVLETFAQPGRREDPVAGPAEPQGFDYEEMRRRIEQTRSRLKAKAFDAMMSGKTALLARDQSERAMAGSGDSLTLDAEVDETIENSLSEEDV